MSKILKESFMRSLGVLIYIAIVAWIIKNGERVFGKMNDLLGPIAFLLLFTLSALICGALILGKPIMLYLDGKKKEAIQMLFSAIAFLGLFTILAIIILALK